MIFLLLLLYIIFVLQWQSKYASSFSRCVTDMFSVPQNLEASESELYVQKLKLCEGQNQLDNITRIDLLWLHAVIWKFRLLENDYWGFAVKGDLKKKERRKTQWSVF